jgi:hypothetical protein
MKCKLCTKNFNHSSMVFELATDKAAPGRDSTPSLAHIECLNCSSCSNRIDIFAEYTLTVTDQSSYSINCKRCVLGRLAKLAEPLPKPSKKQMKSINHRLSSRQKEKLAMRIVAANVEPEKLITEQNSLVLERLAFEIKCSPKALVNYLNKKLIKLTNQQQLEEQKKSGEVKQSSAFHKMIDDLQKLDKVLAPNVCPFGDRTTRTIKATAATTGSCTTEDGGCVVNLNNPIF